MREIWFKRNRKPWKFEWNELKISIDGKQRGLTAKNNGEICILDDDTKSLATALQQT
jgi:hypothetical protein